MKATLGSSGIFWLTVQKDTVCRGGEDMATGHEGMLDRSRRPAASVTQETKSEEKIFLAIESRGLWSTSYRKAPPLKGFPTFSRASPIEDQVFKHLSLWQQ